MKQNIKQDKAKYVHSVFESIAREYDRMNAVISMGRHKSWRRFTMKKMNVQPGEKALDVCCGTGDWTFDLAKATGQNGQVAGLDFSENMLAVGKEKEKEQALSQQQIDWIHGDAMNLPFDDNTFHYATIGFALRNVPDYRHVLAEMTRVVKPGGLVVSLEVSKPLWKPYRKLFFLYFYHILPLLGKLFVNKYEQYSWLPKSLTDFPDSRQLAAVFEQVGLTGVETYRFIGGVAALHIGHKKAE